MGNRDRTRAFLTEFIIVVLFFSIASVLTLQLFVVASSTSKDAKALNNAGMLIETTIEEILAIDSKEEVKDEEILTRYYDSNWKETTKEKCYYVLKVEYDYKEGASGELLEGKVTVSNNTDTVLSAPFAKYFKNGGSDNE